MIFFRREAAAKPQSILLSCPSCQSCYFFFLMSSDVGGLFDLAGLVGRVFGQGRHPTRALLRCNIVVTPTPALRGSRPDNVEEFFRNPDSTMNPLPNSKQFVTAIYRKRRTEDAKMVYSVHKKTPFFSKNLKANGS
jgi:hypothetical protein